MSNSTVEEIVQETNDKMVVVPTNHPTPPVSRSSKIRNKLMTRFCLTFDEDPIISLNVGGKLISTRRSTLQRMPDTVLALICVSPWSESVTKDNDGRIFFDCDPWAFEYILNQLRDWAPTRKVFDLPRDRQERERIRSLCRLLNFDTQLTDGIHRHEKFHQVCGHVLLDEKGLLARHAGSYRFAECRGMNVYSSGIHRITLTLRHQTMNKYNIFLGIVWAGSPMQEKSFELPTAYGWSGQSQVFFKGTPTPIIGYGGYDSDMSTNDMVELTLNCQLSFISLFNHRTKKIYEIPVDTQEGCPLPWQLHVNLHGPDDYVRIINPTPS